MSSRRHILEDSDSDGDGGSPPGPKIFTTEEEHALEKCNIQINNQGKYSEELLAQAIASLGEKVVEDGENELPRVAKGQSKSFFGRDLYKVHGTGVSGDTSPSEETIFHDIEVLRRSGKGTMNTMFKLKETGGEVVFVIWWNYALQRILQLSSDESATNESLGEYTAVMIMRSLFAFIKEMEVIKNKKQLDVLHSKFGIDWVANLKRARRVINHCGPSHFLDKQLSAVEAHVEGLQDKGKVKSASVTTAKNPNETAVGTSQKQAQANAEEEKKREAKASEKRRKKMLGDLKLMRGGPTVTPATSTKMVASSHVGARGSFSQGETLRSPNVASTRLPPVAGGGHETLSSPQRQIIGDRKSPPARSSVGSKSNANDSSHAPPRANNLVNGSDDGWGRKRGEDSSASPFMTKGSWKFARRTLSSKIPDSVQQEHPARNDRPAPRETDPRGCVAGASAALDSIARGDRSRGGDDHGRGRNDYGRDREDPGRGSRDYEGRDRHNRSDNYSSHPSNRGGSRFDGRSSDRINDGGRHDQRDREDYSHGNDHGRDNRRGDEHRSQTPQDHGRGGGYVSQGSKQSRSQDRDGEVQASKRLRGSNEMTALAVSAVAADRGRGADVNDPAWPTQGQKSSSSHRPTVMHGNDNNLAINPGPGLAGMNANHPSGASLGRGAHVNKPAWMTRQGTSSAHPGPTGMPSSNNISANTSEAVTVGGDATGGGRVAHVNRPASMLSNGPTAAGQLEPTSANQHALAINAMQALNAINARGPVRTVAAGAVKGHGLENQGPVRSVNHQPTHVINPSGSVGGFASNERGMGRGRGRGRGAHVNKPAWMTNPKP